MSMQMVHMVTTVIERIKEGVVKPSDSSTKLTWYLQI
jgi:hypothetical protein